MRRWLARMTTRAWARYDRLGELERIGLGVVVVVTLAAASLYFLSAATFIALSRSAPSARAEAPTSPPTATLLPVAPEVDPISPLLAERTPTQRPTITPAPTRTRTPSPGPTVVRVGTATPGRPPSATTPTPTRAVR